MLEDLKRLRGKLNEVLEEFRHLNAHCNDDLLRSEGLYTGLYDGKAAKDYLDRLSDDEEGKKRLSAYMLREAAAQQIDSHIPSLRALRPNSLFCESGTTFIKLIRDYTKYRDVLPHRCHTNNLLVETAWVNIVKDVYALPGRFLAKYYGLFPFADDKSTADAEYEDWGYHAIQKSVAHCDTVLATCSHFSLLAGPLVGSRANALFKNAMYAGQRPVVDGQHQSFVLMFHFTKWIPVCDPPPPLRFKPPDGNCICVLPATDEALPRVQTSNNWYRTWETKDAILAKDEAPFNLRARQWFELLPRVKVLVSLPEQDWRSAYEFLKMELAIVEKYMRQLEGGQLSLQLSSAWHAEHYRICEIQATCR